MNDMTVNRGAAPVGHIGELPPVEAAAVRALRMWCDGAQSQQALWNEFARVLGPERGRRALGSLEQLCELCMRYGRRPLMRHAVHCRCLGADEMFFARLIASASEAAHEDALMLAMTIIRPDMAGPLVGLAVEFAMSLRVLALKNAETREPLPQTGKFH